MSILDEPSFPFHKPEGQELMRVMASLYRTEREAVLFAQPFGIDPLQVVPGLNPINLWHDFLERLAIIGPASLRAAVQAARDQYPGNPRRPFLDALLADRPATASAEPISDRGPGFDDTVTEPEARLFFDDLTMPVGKVPGLIATLQRLIELAPAICLLRVENSAGRFFGTGVRIGDTLVLTNHHVLYPKGKIATSVLADFGFDVDASGASLAVTSLASDTSTVRGEAADDWAVIAVAGMKPEWPIIPLDGAPAPKVGDLTYILQHPGGQQKRLGFVRNMISDLDDRFVRYLTDTEPGSSGAPVFDAGGRVIALHHRGGRPTQVAGKPPATKNEGVQITRVRDRLKATGVIS